MQLYWLMVPGYSKQFSNQEDIIQKGQSWYIADFDLIEQIENQDKTNFYEKQEFVCDPQIDYWETNRIEKDVYEEALRKFRPLC